jgi:hypothetical protein
MSNIASFKVGDRVEAINNDYVYTNLANNWCGEIIGFQYDQVLIRTTSSSSYNDHPEFNFKTIYNILNNENQP